MRIAIQGNRGSFSHACVNSLYQNYELVECHWFDDVFKALNSGSADLAVCPIENSIAGTIIATYDLIRQHPDIHVIGEQFLRIEHQLIGLPGSKLADIKQVYSHPMAIRQCQDFIQSQELQAIETDDTAGSLKKILAENIPGSAAIAGKLAQQIYGGEIIRHNIESDENNYTRFWVMQKSTKQPKIPQSNKVSIVFETDHTPGSLARVLNIFASANLNLTKLESRPIVGKVWRYYFYCDLTSEQGSEFINKVLEIAKANLPMLRVLGEYSQGEVRLT